MISSWWTCNSASVLCLQLNHSKSGLICEDLFCGPSHGEKEMSSVSQWSYALASHFVNLTSTVTAELLWVTWVYALTASAAATAGDVTPAMQLSMT